MAPSTVGMWSTLPWIAAMAESVIGASVPPKSTVPSENWRMPPPEPIDDRELRAREVVHAERADHAALDQRPAREAVAHSGELGGEGDLPGPVGGHPEEPLPLTARRGPADLGVARDPQAADAARVVGIHDARGDPDHAVLPLVARAFVVILAVDEHDLRVDLIWPPLAVRAHAEVC